MITPEDPSPAIPPEEEIKDIMEKVVSEGQVGSVGPSIAEGDPNPLVTEPMTTDDIKEWWKRIERSDNRLKERAKRWDILLKEYTPEVLASGTPEAVKVMVHFRNVHTKIGQLFYKSPEIRLEPDGPAEEQMPNPMAQQAMLAGLPPPPPLKMEDIISVKQEILNKTLGRDGVKATRLFDELLIDSLLWAGIGCSKIGHDATIMEVDLPVMGPDPNYIPPPQPPGNVLGISPTPQPPMVPQTDPLTGQPKTQKVQVTIYQENYWRRFSPKKLVLDDTLRSTRYDEDATYQGMHFYLTPTQAMKKFKLTEAEVQKGGKDDKVASHMGDTEVGDGLVHFVELFVKSSVYTSEPHPLALHQLILMEGKDDAPIVWRPSPDQEFDERHRLTKDSMVGFPHRVLAIRDLPDSPFPDADAAFVNSSAKELNTFRRQDIKLRDAAIGKYAYDTGKIDTPDLDRLKNGEVGEFIGIQSGGMAQGVQSVIAPIAQIHSIPENSRTQTLLKQDIDETLGIGSNQAGIPESTVRSATETKTVQAAVQGRNSKEQARVVDHFLEGVRMLDTLIMRYTDEEGWVQYTGPDGAKRMQMWTGRMVSGKFLYDIAPDSQLSVDTAVDRQQNLNFYNLVAKDPLVNRSYILRRLARQFGYDAAKLILEPAQVPMQPPHGGPGEMVNDHEAAKSGGTPNGPGQPDHRAAQQGGAPQPQRPTPPQPGAPHVP